MDNLTTAVIRFLALLPALTLHEFAHAYSAYRFGDPTPRLEGRVTLNPLAHLDPIGTLMILFGPIGWGKPVHVNPDNMREPARHLMLSTACGPLSNLTQGLAFGLIVRFTWPLLPLEAQVNEALGLFLFLVVLIPFALAFFNLIPLGPLDGHEVLQYFLPYPAKLRYYEFNQRYGMFALMALVLLSYYGPVNVLGMVLRPAVKLTQLLVWG